MPADEVEHYRRHAERHAYEDMRYQAWLHDRAEAIPERRIGDELESRDTWRNEVALRRAQAKQREMLGS